ncbi:YadA-like family protein [Moraxella haemolytica]|uniref:YadA-like family protein n=1 Tax=Moraxella haemolytica TaxID=2904119 RepID=UPI0025428AF9|nr:YadA-like family protein [Moraxella sp. ZY171148]WII95346.1 YadA-like family protein [Moraxella sp. ZY171148]
MNKIFKVKRNSLGQSVVCSEIATSRSKGRVVASALALTVLASATATQAFAQNDTNSSLEPEDLHALIDEQFKSSNPNITDAEHKEYLKLLYKVAVDHEEGIEALSEIVGAVDVDLENFSEWAYRTQHDILSMAENVDAALAIKANKVDVDANTAAIATKADTETVLTLLGNQEKNTQETFADVLNQISTKASQADFNTLKEEARVAKAVADNAVSVNNEQQGKIAENTTAIAQNANDIVDTVKYVNAVAETADTNSIAIAQNTAAIATKANQSAVDALKQADTHLASIAGTNQGNIAKLQTEVGTIGADLKKKADQEQVNTLGNKVDAFDTKINTLQSGHQNLNGKINRLDKDLSAGIAGSVALAMMPAPAAGSQYITGGTGFYNGESAIALGFTGASETGKFTYKLGGSLTSSGSGIFGAGAGYRWK